MLGVPSRAESAEFLIVLVRRSEWERRTWELGPLWDAKIARCDA